MRRDRVDNNDHGDTTDQVPVSRSEGETLYHQLLAPPIHSQRELPLLELTATPSSAPGPPHVPDADRFQRRQPRADGGQLASPSTSPPPGTSPRSPLSIGMNTRQMLPLLAEHMGSGPAPISPFFGAMSPMGGTGLPAGMMEARGEQPPTRLASWPAAAEGGSVGAGPGRVPSMPHATPEPLPAPNATRPHHPHQQSQPSRAPSGSSTPSWIDYATD
mmetsp:Transcript_5697/g.16109  ORF Transcript_5697/g.16109 Transcript_5697/m.16109 type:complete len:217 (+) Transcript_5697:1538-2188(+)